MFGKGKKTSKADARTADRPGSGERPAERAPARTPATAAKQPTTPERAVAPEQPSALRQPATTDRAITDHAAATGQVATNQPAAEEHLAPPDQLASADQAVAVPASGAVTQDQVMNSLKSVTDPEIGLDIVELGLVYGVDITPDGKDVNVSLTLTSPMCPYGPQLVGAAQSAVASVPGVEDAKITLVWVPRWDPREHASEDAKAFLGIW